MPKLKDLRFLVTNENDRIETQGGPESSGPPCNHLSKSFCGKLLSKEP